MEYWGHSKAVWDTGKKYWGHRNGVLGTCQSSMGYWKEISGLLYGKIVYAPMSVCVL